MKIYDVEEAVRSHFTCLALMMLIDVLTYFLVHLVCKERVISRMVGHLTHVQGFLTYEQETYKSFGIIPSEVGCVKGKVEEFKEWDRYLSSELFSEKGKAKSVGRQRSSLETSTRLR